MKVKLKVVQGKLKGKRGESAGLEVVISKARFVIGADKDCHMRCPSSTISPHHCEFIIQDNKVLLRDLGSESGTFLNDERIADQQIVQNGDQLRIGRLAFEVLVEPESNKPASSETDPVDDFVSDMLAQADEEERATRKADPELRQFHLKPNEKKPAESEPEVEEDKLAALRKKIPPKKKPSKLPPPPSITADSTISAAEQTLEKIFEKKPKGPKY